MITEEQRAWNRIHEIEDSLIFLNREKRAYMRDHEDFTEIQEEIYKLEEEEAYLENKYFSNC